MNKFVTAALLLGACGAASAQLSLTGISTASTIDFDSFTGAGFAPAPAAGQLDSDTIIITGLSDGDLAFGGTGDSGDYARGTTTGGVTTGGAYGFDLGGGDVALGIQPAGSDFTPGTIVVALQNNSGDMISEIDVSYDIVVFNDQARGNTVNFAHGAMAAGPFTAEPTLDFESPEVADGVPAYVSTNRSITLSGLNIANGGSYFLQFSSDDSVGGGSRDEIGINNISVTPTAVPVELQKFEIE